MSGVPPKKPAPAPAPYRPQPVPKCLQLKSRQPAARPPVKQPSLRIPPVPARPPSPPPAAPRTLQRKPAPQPASNNTPKGKAKPSPPNGVIQRAQSPLSWMLRNTPLLSFLNVQDISKLHGVSQEVSQTIDRLPLRQRRAIDMPRGHEGDWPIYGRMHKDIVHPLYEQMGGREREEYEGKMARYVDLAYKNMIALVEHHHKVGDAPREADRIAEELSGSNQHWKKGNCVAVVLRRDKGPLIALNELTKKKGGPEASLDKSAQEPLARLHGEFLDMSELEYEHCEIRLWEQFGAIAEYIGIMQPCCLFCAAQLLAAGFTGFRGCHLKTYGRYTFSVKILSSPGCLRRLFGAEVYSWYFLLNARQRLDFLDLLAVAKGAQEKRSKVKKRKVDEGDPH